MQVKDLSIISLKKKNVKFSSAILENAAEAIENNMISTFHQRGSSFS